ncbi:MAG: hypothetical protein L0H73_03245 [Nitrococcus sp.]|nr:hypothetical protein [Nitrococcus sp.]
MYRDDDYVNDDYIAVKRVSWSAIFAGTLAALAVQVVLTLLGLSIGFGVMSQVSGGNALGGIGTGGMIWLVITTLLSLYVGGYISAHLAGEPAKLDGLLNGVLVWALATLLSLYLATSAVGSAVSGVAGIVSQGIQTTTQVATEVTPPAAEPVDKLQQQFGDVREEAAQALDNAQQAAAQKVQKAMPVAPGPAFGGFIALVLGVIAAALGGMTGTPKDVVASTATRR